MNDNFSSQSSERVKSERIRLGLNQAEAADICGVSREMWGKYERGVAVPGGEVLFSFAAAGADIQHILTGANAGARSDDQAHQTNQAEAGLVQSPSDEFHASELVMVPRYDVTASAGGGSVVHSELIVDYLAFRQEWVAKMKLNGKRLCLIEVRGDSMEPVLLNGDLVLIDTRVDRLSIDGIYVVQYRDRLLVKRLQTKLDGTVIISSDNPAYTPEELKPEEAEGLVVVGVVVWYGRGM